LIIIDVYLITQLLS